MNSCGEALLTQRLAAFYSFLTCVVLSFQQMLGQSAVLGKGQNERKIVAKPSLRE